MLTEGVGGGREVKMPLATHKAKSERHTNEEKPDTEGRGKHKDRQTFK